VIIWLTIWRCENLTTPQLTDYADRFCSDRFSALGPGVARVQIGGARGTMPCRIWIDRRALASATCQSANIEARCASEKYRGTGRQPGVRIRAHFTGPHRNSGRSDPKGFSAPCSLRQGDDWHLGPLGGVASGGAWHGGRSQNTFRDNGVPNGGKGIIKQSTAQQKTPPHR